MKFIIAGKFRDTRKPIVHVIVADSKELACKMAMDQGIAIETVTVAADPPPAPALPPAQRVQVVAGVWTIALGVVVGNLVIVGGVLVLAFLLGFFDALARSLAGH